MSFGELNPEPVETEDGFMVGGAIMRNRVKTLHPGRIFNITGHFFSDTYCMVLTKLEKFQKSWIQFFASLRKQKNIV